MSDATVTRVESDDEFGRTEWMVTVSRRLAPYSPDARDLPKDIREALKLWLYWADKLDADEAARVSRSTENGDQG